MSIKTYLAELARPTPAPTAKGRIILIMTVDTDIETLAEDIEAVAANLGKSNTPAVSLAVASVQAQAVADQGTAVLNVTSSLQNVNAQAMASVSASTSLMVQQLLQDHSDDVNRLTSALSTLKAAAGSGTVQVATPAPANLTGGSGSANLTVGNLAGASGTVGVRTMLSGLAGSSLASTSVTPPLVQE